MASMIERTHSHESFEKVRREHKELRELLGQMNRALASREGSVEQACEMFASLSQFVERHFDTEEQGNFFAEIIDHAPRLVDRANATCDEHQQLLAHAKQMHELACEKADTEQWWQRLTSDFQQFSQALMRHESCEMELMQEAYGEDIGSKD
jgi:hemerythrin